MQFNRDFLVSRIRHLDKYNPAPTITGELVGQPIQDGQHSTLTMTIDVDWSEQAHTELADKMAEVAIG